MQGYCIFIENYLLSEGVVTMKRSSLSFSSYNSPLHIFQWFGVCFSINQGLSGICYLFAKMLLCLLQFFLDMFLQQQYWKEYRFYQRKKSIQ